MEATMNDFGVNPLSVTVDPSLVGVASIPLEPRLANSTATFRHISERLTSRPKPGCYHKNPEFYHSRSVRERFYTAHYDGGDVDKGRTASVTFRCLPNYHYLEGDMYMVCLPNNTWDGREPLCEVDYHMEKIRLSTTIGLISFFIPALWLFVDFFMFMSKRRKRRAVTFRFQPVGTRTRVQGIGTYISRQDIAKGILHAIESKQFLEYSSSFEDIFQNKTVTMQPSRKVDEERDNRYQLLGVARAFGKIGKILTTDMY